MTTSDDMLPVAGPNAAPLRPLHRTEQPPGIVDVTAARRVYARTTGLAVQRLAFAAGLLARYGAADRVAPGGELPLARRLLEMPAGEMEHSAVDMATERMALPAGNAAAAGAAALPVAPSPLAARLQRRATEPGVLTAPLAAVHRAVDGVTLRTGLHDRLVARAESTARPATPVTGAIQRAARPFAHDLSAPSTESGWSGLSDGAVDVSSGARAAALRNTFPAKSFIKTSSDARSPSMNPPMLTRKADDGNSISQLGADIAGPALVTSAPGGDTDPGITSAGTDKLVLTRNVLDANSAIAAGAPATATPPFEEAGSGIHVAPLPRTAETATHKMPAGTAENMALAMRAVPEIRPVSEHPSSPTNAGHPSLISRKSDTPARSPETTALPRTVEIAVTTPPVPAAAVLPLAHVAEAPDSSRRLLPASPAAPAGGETGATQREHRPARASKRPNASARHSAGTTTLARSPETTALPRTAEIAVTAPPVPAAAALPLARTAKVPDITPGLSMLPAEPASVEAGATQSGAATMGATTLTRMPETTVHAREKIAPRATAASRIAGISAADARFIWRRADAAAPADTMETTAFQRATDSAAVGVESSAPRRPPTVMPRATEISSAAAPDSRFVWRRTDAVRSASVGAAESVGAATLPRSPETGEVAALANAPSHQPAAATAGAPGATAAGPVASDMEQIAEHVVRLIARRMEIERDRRGGRSWI